MNELTKEELAFVLAEWLRRSREKPEDFAPSNRDTIDPREYGEQCAAYVFELAEEIIA